ncbi:hypothetical protein FB451DRAFT_986764, partial [Mycena latifolia]
AYWSLNPAGAARLSTEAARALGFPSIQLTMRAQGKHCEESVYAELRQFYRGKGFDAHTQDVARYLDY